MKSVNKAILLFSIAILSFSIPIGLFSCSNKKSKEETNNEHTGSHNAIEVILNNTTPTVDIGKYTLIENQGKDRRNDADQILELKRKWPLVMQSPNRAGFDAIFSKNFTFIGEGKLLNREDYIKDRTKASDWIITYVKYDNLVLQFFDNIALLTYQNIVTNENIITKEIEIEHISWADIYVLENKKWKIGSTHVVDISIKKESQK